ncbi:MAG: hypothetical protein ABIK37_00955 [candidate division WOR-3 bacterium]
MPLLNTAAVFLLLNLPAVAATQSCPRVEYELACRLNEQSHTIAGRARINYISSATDSLRSIWFLLYPNSFRSRHTAYGRALRRLGQFNLARARTSQLGRIDIHGITCDGAAVAFRDDSTTMELNLPTPLAPGETTTIEIEFSTRIPDLRGPLSRTGRNYVLTRWFPQVAAFDTGWHLGRFHPFGGPVAAFADYNLTLIFNSDLQIAATGWPSAVLPAGRQTAISFSAAGVTDFALVISPELVPSAESSGTLRILAMSRRPKERPWLNLTREIPAIVDMLSGQLGPFPYPALTVVQADGLVESDVVAPGLVLLAQKPIPFTRLQEKALAAALAAQWFACATAPDPVSEPWLVYGLPAYAAARYLESRYGADNLLDLPGLPFTLGATDEYLHRYNYYLASSNRLTRPVISPLPEFPDNATAFEAVTRSQTALLLLAFERRFGSAVLNSGLRRYLETGLGRHPVTPAFLSCLSAAAGPEHEGEISRWFLTDGTDDIALVGCGPSGCLKTHGDAHSPQPITLSGMFKNGGVFRDTLQLNGAATIRLPRAVRSAVLDPERLLLEANRWNNHWPRSVLFRPLFGLPSFDSYQLFYGPWFWFDTYRGFQPGAWLQGREFVDAGPMRGRHMWTIQANYCTAMEKDPGHIGFSYQTPLLFLSNRTRLFLAGDWSFRDEGAKAYLSQDIGNVFSLPSMNVDLGYRMYNLKTAQGRDPRAWSEARTAILEARLLHSYATPLVAGSERCRLERGFEAIGSQFDYWRLSTEQIHRFTLDTDPIAVLRVFAGATIGATPDREQFYLSGGLTYNSAEPASFGYSGKTSAQEHWHYDADVNCRGFSGRYAHGRFAWGLNFYLTPLKWAQPFFDIGNVGAEFDRYLWQPRMDAGIRLRLGPFYADIVGWRWELGQSQLPGRNWTHFWMLGFKLNELTSGF